jgi:hypothetical protein
VAWPLVFTVVFFSLSLFIVDYFWRVVTMPFEAFLLYGIFIIVVVGALLIVSWRLCKRPVRAALRRKVRC